MKKANTKTPGTPPLSRLLAELQAITASVRDARDDVQTMATVLDSYMARDRLLRKIIVRTTGIKTNTEVPADVRRMLVEAGMITDAKPKEE